MRTHWIVQASIALFGIATATAQPIVPQWTGHMLSTNSFCELRALRTDAAGNVIACGAFGGTIDMDPGPGVSLVASTGFQEPWVAKFDQQGNLLWGFGITHAANDEGRGRALDVDADGNVYVTGSYENNADFDPGSGIYTVPTPPSTYSDVFVAKYSSDGELVWAFGFGGAQGDEGNAVTVSPAGMLAVAAVVSGSPGDMDPGPGVDVVTGSGGGDGVLGLYTTAGTYAWGLTVGGDLDDGISMVDFDPDGNVVVSGEIRATVDIDPNGYVTLPGNANDLRQYLIKYSAQRELLWGVQFPSPTGSDYSSLGDGRSMKVDPAGRIYLAGAIRGTVDMDPGPGTTTLVGAGLLDAYVARYNTNGAFEWAKRTGNTQNSYHTSLTLDGARLLLTGLFSGTVDVDPDGGTALLTSIGMQSGYLASYDTSGAYQWALRLSGDQSFNTAQTTALLADNALVVGGAFFGDMDADPGSNTTLLQAGSTKDSYIIGFSDMSVGLPTAQQAAHNLLWPVPATEILHLAPEVLQSTTTLTIVDAMGRAIQQLPAAATIGIAQLPAGLYALQRTDGSVILGRFVKDQ